MNLNKDVSNRIAMLRFLMIFGVIALHTPMYVDLAQLEPGVFNYIKAFFQHAVFRATVPVLSFVSGLLLFSSGLDQNPMKLFNKKAKSVVLPYLVFNLTLLAAVYVVQLKTGMTSTYTLPGASVATWFDAGLGLTAAPINYPLNFMRDLIVLMLLAPLFGYVIRKFPVAGLIAITGIFMSNMDGYLILRETMPVHFYLGALAAVYSWNLQKLDKLAVPMLVVFVLVCVAVVMFRVTDRTYLRLVAPLMVWPAASLLVNTQVGIWLRGLSKYSFFLFLAHAPVLLASYMVYQKFSAVIPYSVYWFAAPVVTSAILIAVYRAAMYVAPRAFGLIVGVEKSNPKPIPAAIPVA